MKRQDRIIGGLFLALLAAAGCGKGTDTGAAAKVSAAEPATSAAKSSIASAPIAAAPTTPVAAIREAAAATASAPVREALAANVSASPAAAAPAERSADPSAPITPAATASSAPAATAAAVVESPEAIRKKAQIAWALKQDEIKNDPNGQWAAQAKASSTFNDATGNAGYSASQATGAPNVENYGSSPAAWSTKTPDAGIEWLDLQYAKPVHATTVRVRESYGSGAVIKVELFDEQGVAHTVWTGSDPTKDVNYLVCEFPKTAYKTARVKVTLATNIVPGWNAIDAVQLVGTDQ
jgi:hypothetical protein